MKSFYILQEKSYLEYLATKWNCC